MGFNITFNTNGGDGRGAVTVGDDSWTEIEKPAYAGHVFAGWIATGHAKATAVYSTDDGATSVKMEADPMPVAVDSNGKVKVKNLRTDGETATLTAQWRTVIGGANVGCPTIELPPFTPICSKGGVERSEPLTLEVPSPVFAPAVPPPECACFTFAQRQNAPNSPAVAVNVHAGNKHTAQGTVDIRIASVGDCCDGKYEITPTFTLDIPECVQRDAQIAQSEVSLGAGGKIKYTLSMENCLPQLKIEQVTPVQQFTGAIPNFCLAGTSLTVNVTSTQRNAQGTPTQVGTGTITVTPGTDSTPGSPTAGCMKYEFGTLDLDLSPLDFGNDGSVYQGDDGNLYTDGALTPNVNMWYGGGAGDRGDDAHASLVFSRGPLMRGLSGNQTGPAGSGDHEIPHRSNIPYQITTQTAQGATTPQAAGKWRSANADNADPDTTGGWATGNLTMTLPAGFQWDKRGLAVNLSTLQWNEGGLLNAMIEPGYAALVAPGLACYKSGATLNGRNVGGKDISGLAILMAPTTASQHEPGLIVNDGLGLRVFGADAKTDNSEITASTVDEIGELDIFAHSGDFLFNWDEKMVLNDEKAAQDTAYPDWGTTELDLQPYNDGTTCAYIPRFYRQAECTIPVVTANYVAGAYAYWTPNLAINCGTSGDGDPPGLIQYKTGPALLGPTLNGTGGLNDAAAKITTLGHYLGSIDKADCPDCPTLSDSTLKTAINYLFEIVSILRYAANYTTNSLGTLAMIQMHVAKSGIIMAADEKPGSQHVARHYQATQPT